MDTNNKELLAEVKELLNQVVIKLQGVPEVLTTQDDNYQTIVADLDSDDEDGNPMVVDIDQQKLACIRDIVTRLVANDSSALRNETKYYSSNC